MVKSILLCGLFVLGMMSSHVDAASTSLVRVRAHGETLGGQERVSYDKILHVLPSVKIPSGNNRFKFLTDIPRIKVVFFGDVNSVNQGARFALFLNDTLVPNSEVAAIRPPSEPHFFNQVFIEKIKAGDVLSLRNNTGSSVVLKRAEVEIFQK